MNSQQIKNMIRSLFLSKEQRPYLVAMLIAAVLALYWDLHDVKPAETPQAVETRESADTFIPDGFVLVPIEVQNSESLDSILGKFGVVDLYQANLRPGARPMKVATHVKIMRAPLNPNHFAVLVREDESISLVSTSLPFTVVVQRPARPGEKPGTRIEDPNAAVETRRLTEAQRLPNRAVKRISRITIEVPNADPVPESVVQD